MSIYFNLETLAPSTRSLLSNPLVRVALSDWGTDTNGCVFLGGTLASASEIDFQINQMVEELEVVRQNAKRAVLR